MNFKFFLGTQSKLEPIQTLSLTRNNFKFFYGLRRKLSVVWIPETDGREYYSGDVEEQFTRLMSRQIANEIDNQIINNLSEMMNVENIQIVERNVDVDYLNYYLGMGENIA